MVSPPPCLPVLGLEGTPQGQNHLSLAKSAVPSRAEWELQQAQAAQDGTLLLHPSSLLYSKHCALGGGVAKQ